MRYLTALRLAAGAAAAVLIADAAYRLTCGDRLCQPSPIDIPLPLWLSLTIGIVLTLVTDVVGHTLAELATASAILLAMVDGQPRVLPLLISSLLVWNAVKTITAGVRAAWFRARLSRSGAPAIGTVIGLRSPGEAALWIVPDDGTAPFGVEQTFPRNVLSHLRVGGSVGVLFDKVRPLVLAAYPLAGGRVPGRIADLSHQAEARPVSTPDRLWLAPPPRHRERTVAVTLLGLMAAIAVLFGAYAAMACWPGESACGTRQAEVLLLVPVLVGAIARGLGSRVSPSMMIAAAGLGGVIAGTPRAWIVLAAASVLAVLGFFVDWTSRTWASLRDHGVAAVATVVRRWPSRVSYRIETVDGSAAFTVDKSIDARADLDVGMKFLALVDASNTDHYQIYLQGEFPLRLSALAASLAQDRPIAR